MLTTLTCLTGLYCGTGATLIAMNNFYIKFNMLQTLKGKKFFVKPVITNEGYMYTLSKEKTIFNDVGVRNTVYCDTKNGYTFTMEDEPTYKINEYSDFSFSQIGTTIFDNQKTIGKLDNNMQELYKTYKTDSKMVKVKYSKLLKTGDVWYLADKNNVCSLMAEMDEKSFKEFVINKYKFPFLVTSYCVFLLLCLACFVRWLDENY
jgi:hypothetical protein